MGDWLSEKVNGEKWLRERKIQADAGGLNFCKGGEGGVCSLYLSVRRL